MREPGANDELLSLIIVSVNWYGQSKDCGLSSTRMSEMGMRLRPGNVFLFPILRAFKKALKADNLLVGS